MALDLADVIFWRKLRVGEVDPKVVLEGQMAFNGRVWRVQQELIQGALPDKLAAHHARHVIVRVFERAIAAHGPNPVEMKRDDVPADGDGPVKPRKKRGRPPGSGKTGGNSDPGGGDDPGPAQPV